MSIDSLCKAQYCAQLEAPPVDQAEYTAYRTATDLREPYRLIQLFVAASSLPLLYLHNKLSHNIVVTLDRTVQGPAVLPA